MIPIGRGADPIDPRERAAELELYAAEYRRLEGEGLVTEPRETDTAELRRLAEAATAGPWYAWGTARGTRYHVSAHNVQIPANELPTNYFDAAYIAAVNPTVVLGLLDRIEALEGALRNLRDPWAEDHDADGCGSDCPWVVAASLLESRP